MSLFDCPESGLSMLFLAVFIAVYVITLSNGEMSLGGDRVEQRGPVRLEVRQCFHSFIQATDTHLARHDTKLWIYK